MLILLGFVTGITICAFLPELFSLSMLAMAGGSLMAGWYRLRLQHIRAAQVVMVLLAVVVGLAYATGHAQLRLQHVLAPEWEQKPIEFIGVIRGLPNDNNDRTSLQVEVEAVLTPKAGLPSQVQLFDNMHRSWPTGSRWQLSARFKRPHGTANPHGFNSEQWMWSQGLLATGSAAKSRQFLGSASGVLVWVDARRAAVVERLTKLLGKERGAGLIAALTVGEQHIITKDDWLLFSRTGLTHLVSISGLHITMVAGIAALLARWILRRWPTYRVSPRVVIAFASVAAALCYSLLAGFSVPTQRTFLMLAVVAVMLVWRRSLSGFQIWCWALTLVLLLDPFAVLTPGLWLSFGLVAALMMTSLGRIRQDTKWLALLKAQWAALIMSLVPLALFFGSYPLVSPLANALAIPFVSVVLTPLSLLAVALPLDWPLHLIAWLIRYFYMAVEWLAKGPQLSLPALPAPILVSALIGCLWLMAPRGMAGRVLGGFLLMPLFFYTPPSLKTGQFRATVMDVGQGLSVLIQTASHTVLFDTGMLDAGKVVLPQLQGNGVDKLDMLILSHHDNDHDGAAAGVMAGIPVRRVLVGQQESLQAIGVAGDECYVGQNWVWDGILFQVLSPDRQQVGAEDNDKSCVLRVAGWNHALMISADASIKVEQPLVRRFGHSLRSTILVAGHHGSKTSTSNEWLQAVQPVYTIMSAGYLNRYHHPHPTVLAKVKQSGSKVIRTDRDGAITVDVAQHVSLHCARNWRSPYWMDKQNCGSE